MSTPLRSTAIAFLVLGGIGLIWFFQGANTEKSESLKTNPRIVYWEEGASQQYSLAMDSSMSMSTVGSGQNQNVQVRIRALLDLLTLSADADSALAGMQLSNLELSVSGQSDSEMNRVLQKPFRVQFLSSGVPAEFEFPAGLNAQEQTMLENIVRTFTVSVTENRDEWVSSEKSAAGDYEAVYKKVAPGQLEKNKRNFVASPSSPMLATATISSTENIELDGGNNWITRMTVDETLQTPGKGGPTISIANHASIALVPNVRASGTKDRWEFAAASAEPSPTLVRASTPQMSPEQARRKLIAALPALDATTQGRTKLIHELRDLLQVDGSIPAALLEQLKTQVLSDRTRADLYLALELASTVEAQAALTEVITQPDWSTRDAMRATVALAGINNPTPETLGVLWETAYADGGQLSTTATYTLGSMGSRMKAANNPEYKALRDTLLNQAYAGGNALQRASFIYALGNTRDADMAPDVSAFLQDDHPAIRRAAALSLGLMRSPQGAEALVSRFEQENNSQVRGAIAESLIRLPIADSSPVMASFNNAIKSESDEGARYAMASFLGANLNKHPQYKSELQALLRNEPSKRVRQTIAEALAGQ